MSHSILGDHLPEVMADVRRLRGRFSQTAPRDWDAVTAAAELSVQLGHLALCLLRRNGSDTTDLDDPQRPIANIGDELADIMLATLSIMVLAEVEPAGLRNNADRESDEKASFLRLLVAIGRLCEVAMVTHRYRHRPTGASPSLPDAAAHVLTTCEMLADRLEIDLLSEFRIMVADADWFLDNRGDAL